MSISDELKAYITELYESISGDSYAEKKLSGGLYLVVKVQSLEEKIKNYKNQIQAMQNCQNCIHYKTYVCGDCFRIGADTTSQYHMDYWQMKEVNDET